VVALHDVRNHLQNSIRDAATDWVEQLRSLVPTNAWKCLRISGDLTNREEGEYRLRKLDQQRRAIQIIAVATVALTLVWVACWGLPGLVRWWNVPFLGVGWKLLMTAIMILIVSHAPIIVLAVAWSSRRILQTREADLHRQMAELANGTVNKTVVTAVSAA
jgi:hypothetical protein